MLRAEGPKEPSTMLFSRFIFGSFGPSALSMTDLLLKECYPKLIGLIFRKVIIAITPFSDE
jgi:hypothetical protein